MQRTAPIYKSSTIGAASLKDMARRTCTKYVRNLVNIGDCPVELIQSVIDKIDNADQLYTLEINCPQILGHTKTAWINLIKHNMPQRFLQAQLPPDWTDTMFPLDKAERWHKIFFKLQKMAHKESLKREQALASTMKGLRDERKSAVATVSDRKLAPTGKSSYATSTYNINAVLYGSSKGKHNDAFFSAIKRGMQGTKLKQMKANMPMIRRPNNGGVKAAPAYLVNELKERKEREKDTQIWKEQLANEKSPGAASTTRTSRPGFGASNPRLHAGGQSYDLNRDREARLRALKNGTKVEASQLTLDFLESDDDEHATDEDLVNNRKSEHSLRHAAPHHDRNLATFTEDEDEDLFGDPTARAKSHSPPRPSLKAPEPTRTQIGSTPNKNQSARAATASPLPSIFAKPRPSARPLAAPSRKLAPPSTAQIPAPTAQNSPPKPRPVFFAPEGDTKRPVKTAAKSGQKRKAAEPLAKILGLDKRRR